MGISYGPNLTLLELENRDWKQWMMNEVVSNPNKYRISSPKLTPLFKQKKKSGTATVKYTFENGEKGTTKCPLLVRGKNDDCWVLLLS